MMQDYMTSAQAVMDTDHAYIHLKKGFNISTNTGAVSAAGSYKFAFTTPATGERTKIHLRPTSFTSTANIMLLQIHEDSAFTGGTLQYIDNHYREQNQVRTTATLKAGVTAALGGKNIIASTAGGDFGNQPANDIVQVVSDDNTATDKGQIVTIYGTLHGADTVVVSATAVLNGTTAVDFAGQFGRVLGVEMSAAAAGTVTIQEKSGSAAITTIAAASTSAGIATIADSRGRDRILRIDADGASTKYIGVIGTNSAGASIGVAAALDGTTEKSLSTDLYRTITKVLLGDVEAGVEAWVLRQEVILYQNTAGSGGGPNGRSGGIGGGMDEYVLEPATDYIINVQNIGASDASTAYLDFFFYEEENEGQP